MHLTQHTDFALRILLYLGAHPDGTPSTTTISKAFGISAHHTASIAKRLVQDGILVAKRGRNGGVRLAVNPRNIKLGDLVMRMERSMQLVECFDARSNRCPITAACRLKGALAKARDAFVSELNDYTLADLVDNGPQLVRSLRKKTPRPAPARG